MKKTVKYFLSIAIASSIISCRNSNNPIQKDNTTNDFSELYEAMWLIGEWQNNSPEGNATEVWEKKNDSVLEGKSYFVVENDTVSSESISLEQIGKDLFYIPTVKGQNSGQPVIFSLTLSTKGQLVFENTKHDFPQKISYTQITNDSLLAEISGMIDGKQNSQKFPMKRVK